MELSECLPGIIVCHNRGFYGIIKGGIVRYPDDHEVTCEVEVITTDGHSYWAYPGYMSKYHKE